MKPPPKWLAPAEKHRAALERIALAVGIEPGLSNLLSRIAEEALEA